MINRTRRNYFKIMVDIFKNIFIKPSFKFISFLTCTINTKQVDGHIFNMKNIFQLTISNINISRNGTSILHPTTQTEYIFGYSVKGYQLYNIFICMENFWKKIVNFKSVISSLSGHEIRQFFFEIGYFFEKNSDM